MQLANDASNRIVIYVIFFSINGYFCVVSGLLKGSINKVHIIKLLIMIFRVIFDKRRCSSIARVPPTGQLINVRGF